MPNNINKLFNNIGVNYSVVSNGITFFKDRFNKRYNLLPYKDEFICNIHYNVVFFGFYYLNDWEKYFKCKSIKYILFGGTDINPSVSMRNIKLIKQYNLSNIFVLSKKAQMNLEKFNIRSTYINMNLVDTSLFYPIKNKKKTNKIYCYNGSYGCPRPQIYGGLLLKQVQDKLPQFEYIYSSSFKLKYNEMPAFYNKIFIVLRLTPEDGNANTVQECEAMNIPVVHNISDYGLKYTSVEDIITHILTAYESQ